MNVHIGPSQQQYAFLRFADYHVLEQVNWWLTQSMKRDDIMKDGRLCFHDRDITIGSRIKFF